MAGLERTAGGLRLRLAAEEVRVLASLAEGLAQRTRSDATPGDTVLERLTPQVSRGDEEVDRELRSLLREDLLGLRASRLEDLVALLGGPTARGAEQVRDLDRELDRDEAMRVVEALNDLRLALAATVGYDADMRDELAEGDHREDAVRLMDALAWLQGGLIEYVEADGPH